MLEQIRTVFIVGIKGVAMANLARILSQMGKEVAGSDIEETFITEKVLRESDVQVFHSFSAEVLPPNIDLVIYAAAHGGKENPQVQEALRRGVMVKHQMEVLAEILATCSTSIAVCGCHGKTTTSSLLSYVLHNLDVHPSHMVGVSDFNGHLGGEYGEDTFFVAEADEYGLNPPYDKTPKFHLLNPTHVIATNIDFDHPDVYADIEETKEAFKIFLQKPIKQVFACADDVNLMSIVSQLPRERYQTFGYDSSADLVIHDVQVTEEAMSFELIHKKNSLGRFTLSLFGPKNASNAAGVVLCLLSLGFSVDAIRAALVGFTGAKRRFEKIFYQNDTYLFDDYAHHPEEIEATIQAARSRFPNRRLIVIFQPHTFSRTESLKDEFIQALAKADQALLMPIFASAREQATGHNISSIHLAELARQRGIHTIEGFHSKKDVVETLRHQVKRGDVVFTMGAGDVYTLKEELRDIMKKF